MEFHISSTIRKRLQLDDTLFSYTGNVVFANVSASRKLAKQLGEIGGSPEKPDTSIDAGALFAMGLIDELSHALIAKYRKTIDPTLLSEAANWFTRRVPAEKLESLLLAFTEQFPSVAVFRGDLTAKAWLAGTSEGLPNREAALEEMLLLWLANSNAALKRFQVLFDDASLKAGTAYEAVTEILPGYLATRPPVGPGLGSLLDALRAPMLASPDSITGQLNFIQEHWSEFLGEDLSRVLLAIDVLREEEIGIWMRFHPAGPDRHRHGQQERGGEGFVGDEYIGFETEYVTGTDGVRRRRYAEGYQAPLNEYEAFSADQFWMPTVVLIAKNTYVWLEQLSKQYGQHIHRLDQIPDEELQILATRGITGLWLIGLWERSRASKTIKRLRGNSDAVASAYSLMDYMIAEDLGGEAAYENLRNRAARAGLRLASDMVPNHMGIDSPWVIEHPERFIYRSESPYPAYRFEGPDLSTDSRVEIKIEDHYYDQTDAAVVFRLRHHADGATRYMYHGNDGTTFAWNDTAQIDYSKQEVREHVIQVILDVARRFPIIRFDAAMVLARRHVQRLWFPLPGAGGSIPSRAEDAMSQEAFDALMPLEFWREVVDRVAVEVPGTLLLAEAFWLLEGYFVRTLGMHRVYNSAFMNMLRDEENAKYRSYLKKTVEFDPDILKRYVNFMSNPDERTAFDQFGSGDKFFGVSVLLATLPGLPMVGHGQVEGFTERYGMDFKQARLEEQPNEGLIARHQQQIAPLLKKRDIFAESTHFLLYDFWGENGSVDENVFAYSNRSGDRRAIVLYNNTYGSTSGTIHMSVGYLSKESNSLEQKSLSDGLALHQEENLVISYRDTISGMAYLRRASSFRDQGLSLPLRGYQHVVLLEWRELRSTEAYPWDRLCDLLNGAGVYNLDEALGRLRLQPLAEAVRQVLDDENIEAFRAAASAQQEAPIPTKPAKATSRINKMDNTQAAAIDSVQEAKRTRFTDQVTHFAKAVAELSQPDNVDGDDLGRSAYAASPSLLSRLEEWNRLLKATASIPQQVAAFPAALRPVAQAVFPSDQQTGNEKLLWAPVLAWLTLQSLGSPRVALARFDELDLRRVFSEAFASLGMEAEQGWKSAAQIRVLLNLTAEGSIPAALRSYEFWADPDVRWLAGINDDGFFNKEQFEALLCWLQLPVLLSTATKASPDIVATETVGSLEDFFASAKTASYKVKQFLEPLPAKPEPAAKKTSLRVSKKKTPSSANSA